MTVVVVGVVAATFADDTPSAKEKLQRPPAQEEGTTTADSTRVPRTRTNRRSENDFLPPTTKAMGDEEATLVVFLLPMGRRGL